MSPIPHPEISSGSSATPAGSRSSPGGSARSSAQASWPPAGALIEQDHQGSESAWPRDASSGSGGAPEGASGRISEPGPALALSRGLELSLLALELAAGTLQPGLEAQSPETPSVPRNFASFDGFELAAPPMAAIGGDASAPALRATGAALAPRAEPAGAKLVERGLHALLQQRGGMLIMRLSPPDLGVLEIRMRWELGRLEVLFRPSTLAARELLEGSLGMLRHSLQRHGVGIGRLAVEPPVLSAIEESIGSEIGHSFDAGGRESRGRQEAERQWQSRTEAGLVFGRALRPAGEIAPTAAQGRSSCSSHHPAPPIISSPAASAS